MSKFNKVQRTSYTVNRESAKAYKQSPELELTSLLFTHFLEDTFYDKEVKVSERLETLLEKVDLKFAVNAIIYARREMGMRSVTHLAAAKLAQRLSGTPYGSYFYEGVVARVDDIMEIMGAYNIKKNTLPNSMKKGFAKAFNGFDGYLIGKYKASNKEISLVDVVNLVHPKPTPKNKKALYQLMNSSEVGAPKARTWESTLSNKEDTRSKKAKWADLILSRKLGYLALLKNLRNILETNPDDVVLQELRKQLTNREKLIRSKVLPFRVLSAYAAVFEASDSIQRDQYYATLQTLESVCELSLDNIPNLPGKTAIVLDTSGSMWFNWWLRTDSNQLENELKAKSPIMMGAYLSMLLHKKLNSDLWLFDSTVRKVRVNILDSIMTNVKLLLSTNRGGATYLHKVFSAFSEYNASYDRIIVLSDMQVYGDKQVNDTFKRYVKKLGFKPVMYTVDLKNYGNMAFPENNVVSLAGYSDKIFKFMKDYENFNPKILVKRIKEYDYKENSFN